MSVSNDDFSGGHISIFSNKKKPEMEPPNPYWLTRETKHGDFEELLKPKEHRHEKMSDIDPIRFPPIDWDLIHRRVEQASAADAIARKSMERSIANFNRKHRQDTRIVTNDFETSFQPAMGTGTVVFWAFAGVMGVILVLMLIAKPCGKKSNRSSRGEFEAARAAEVQRYLETRRADNARRLATTRRPPAQRDNPRQFTTCQISGAYPPSSDVPPPYSECVNHTVSEQPPSYTNLADTQPPVHNGLVETGLRNHCVAMTTTPNNSEDVKTELIFDNGRIVERRSLDLSKETGQGAKHSDVTNKVVYVDVHSYSKAVLD